jgi:ketosteroid isomerase-like protein
MNELDRLALLRDGVAAFNRGDAGPALAIFAEDVECYVSPDLMNAGTYRGHEGYLRMIGAWGEAWQTVTAEFVDAEELDGEHLLVEIDQRAIGAGSGVPVRMRLYWLFQFRGLEVVRFHLYGDRDDATAAAAVEAE